VLGIPALAPGGAGRDGRCVRDGGYADHPGDRAIERARGSRDV